MVGMTRRVGVSPNKPLFVCTSAEACVRESLLDRRVGSLPPYVQRGCDYNKDFHTVNSPKV